MVGIVSKNFIKAGVAILETARMDRNNQTTRREKRRVLN